MNTRILVIDADRSFRRALRVYLENCGFVCQEADEGLQALALMDGEFGVDLILSDYHIPVINGINILKVLSSRVNGQDVRGILLSGNITLGINVEAEQSGAFKLSRNRMITRNVSCWSIIHVKKRYVHWSSARMAGLGLGENDRKGSIRNVDDKKCRWLDGLEAEEDV